MNLSSFMHSHSPLIDLDLLQMNVLEENRSLQDLDPLTQYSLTKLALLLMTKYFGRSNNGSSPSFFAVNPGWVQTNILRHKKWKSQVLKFMGLTCAVIIQISLLFILLFST